MKANQGNLSEEEYRKRLKMESFSEEDKNLMRTAQFNRCAMCRKELEDNEGEAHAIHRSHVYWLNGVLLCKDCHKPNYSYGRPPLKVGDPLNPLILLD